VRLGRYILAELLVATTALLGFGIVVGWGSSALAYRAGQAEAARRAAALALPAREALSAPVDPPITDEPAGTFLGMADDLLLARVRSQPIVAAKVNRGGSSLSFRVEFADGSRAAFKPAQTNLQTIPRKEVAAYRINRLLGLNAVPPAAPRQVGRDELLAHLHPDSVASLPRIHAETIFNPLGKTAGVMSYWIPEIKESGLDTPEGIEQSFRWLSQAAPPPPPEKRHMAQQLSDLVVFDFLTSNPDRYSGGNMKMSPDGERLYYMDNTMAFFLDPNGPEKNRALLQKTQRFSRRLYDALGRISALRLEQVLRESGVEPHEILTPAEIRAVVARRDVVRRHIDALSALHGSNNVLVFP
jgi:hypothetical protein